MSSIATGHCSEQCIEYVHGRTDGTYGDTTYVERSSYESNARGSGEPIDLIGVGR